MDFDIEINEVFAEEAEEVTGKDEG